MSERVVVPLRRRVDPIYLGQRPIPRRRSLAGRLRLAAARAGYRPDHADALALAVCAAAAVVSMLIGGGGR